VFGCVIIGEVQTQGDKAMVEYTSVVAAETGWSVAIVIDGKVVLDPIIAWEISRLDSKNKAGHRSVMHLVIPILIGGSAEHLYTTWWCKRPDGCFVDEEGEPKTEEELMATAKERGLG
jgi:hypothetical protein